MKVQSVRNDQAYDGYTVLALCVSTVYPRLVFENTKRRILRKLVVNDERKCERRRKKKEKKKKESQANGGTTYIPMDLQVLR